MHISRAGSPSTAQNQPGHQMTEVQPIPVTYNDIVAMPHSKWENLTSGVNPSAFTEGSYTLQGNVIEIDSKTSSAARNAIAGIAFEEMLLTGKTAEEILTGKTDGSTNVEPNTIIALGGYIDKDVLRNLVGRDIENGTVVFDKETGTAFKVTAPFTNAGGPNATEEINEKLGNTYMLETPLVNEIFLKCNFGGDGEEVPLNYGNFIVPDDIADCLSEEAKSSIQFLSSGNSGFKHVNDHAWGFPLTFDSKELTASIAGGGKVQVRLQGGLSFGDIKLMGHYDLPFGTYCATVEFSQEMWLSATFAANISQEVYIPLMAIDVPFGIGSVRGGLYLVLGLDGEFRVEVQTREYTTPKMGVEGKTCFCLPATISPVFSLGDKGLEGDVKLNGRLTLSARIGPMLEIRICGVDLLGAGALYENSLFFKPDLFSCSKNGK